MLLDEELPLIVELELCVLLSVCPSGRPHSPTAPSAPGTGPSIEGEMAHPQLSLSNRDILMPFAALGLLFLLDGHIWEACRTVRVVGGLLST